MKNILVTGSCQSEVQGVLCLLKGMGTVAAELGDATPTPNDLVIVAMSAIPLLGWAEQFPRLLDMKLRWRCELVVLVPNVVASIRLLEGVGCIIPGGYSLDWMSKVLMSLVAKWRQSKALPVGNVRRLSRYSPLGVDDVEYFFTLMFPVVGPLRMSKTAYGRRSRAMTFMGFSHLQQAKLFMAGISPREMRNAVVVSLSRSVPTTNMLTAWRRGSCGVDDTRLKGLRVN